MSGLTDTKPPHSTKSVRPEKPSSDFPLYAHRAGQWAKKIKGKTHYFGPWDDPQGALARYQTQCNLSEQPAPKQPAVNHSTVESNGRPKKPYANYPLYAHANGQWAKVIKGKIWYFGPWADPHAALTNYLSQKDDLEAGRQPQAKMTQTSGLTVEQMVNLFLADKKLKVESGEMEATTWKRYECYGDRMIRVWGKNRLVETLTPKDFLKYRADLQETHKSLESLKSGVIKTRVFFNWAGPGDEGQNYIRSLPRFGAGLKVPSLRAIKRKREQETPRVLSAEQIRRILDEADKMQQSSDKLRAMILLGINCGYGNTDCALVPKQFIDLETGWATFARPKTGTKRRNPLWPETIEVLRRVLDNRKNPTNKGDAGLVFITKRGLRFHPSAIGFEFEKLAEKAGMSRDEADFYDLRRTCISVGLQVTDDDAMRTISGHQRKGDDMLGLYNRLTVSDERLLAVTDHIRSWLFPAGAARSSEDGDKPQLAVLAESVA